MTSTINDIRSAIEARIATEMATSPTYSVSYQNVPFTPDATDTLPWVQVFITLGENRPATLLAAADGFNLQVGTLVMNIFSPLGKGSGDNFTIAERLKDLFDRVTVQGVRFDSVSGPRQVPSPLPESFFQTQLTATFEATLD